MVGLVGMVDFGKFAPLAHLCRHGLVRDDLPQPPAALHPGAAALSETAEMIWVNAGAPPDSLIRANMGQAVCHHLYEVHHNIVHVCTVTI